MNSEANDQFHDICTSKETHIIYTYEPIELYLKVVILHLLMNKQLMRESH